MGDVSITPIPPGTVWAELSATVRVSSRKGSRAGARTYLLQSHLSAASSLRKPFPPDNLQMCLCLSLGFLCCSCAMLPQGLVHTLMYPGSRCVLCTSLPDCYESRFCMWCAAQLCLRVYVPPDPQRTRPGGRLCGNGCGSTKTFLLHCSLETMLRSASHLLPLDTVV